MKQKLTVVCAEGDHSLGAGILIYTVEADPNDQDDVTNAVEVARQHDLGEHVDMEILFAFAGDIATIADWRE